MIAHRAHPRPVLRQARRLLAFAALALWLSGCGTFPAWLGSSGPSREQVQDTRGATEGGGIQLVQVNAAVTRRLLAGRKQHLFSEVFGAPARSSYAVGPGDVIGISVWEAPPAMLFGTGSPDGGPSTSHMTTFPEQMVSSDGTVNVPFAGYVAVAGHTPQWIEEEIARRLHGKANQPQVLVRMIRNATSTVTLVGEVASSSRMPLTAGGERLLDALASAGGVKQPVSKTTLQVTRGDIVQSLPLDTIIRDPRQNIALQPGDVVTALYQSQSFTVLGATGKNDEVNFEAQGISLAQALARAGGLNDTRADARAVFVFRFEDRSTLDWRSPPPTTPEGKVPVIYELDLRDPASFFVAQSFPVQNKDVLYVSNAPATELQKFLAILIQSAVPLVDVAILKNVTR